MPTQISGPAAAKILSSVRYVLLDIDGVIWSGANVISRVPETLKHIRSMGKEIRFLTNNASVSRKEVLQQFEKRGIEGVSANEVYNSAYAAALRLQQLLGKKTEGSTTPLVHGNVFVIGEQGLHDELRQVLAPGFITYGVELHDAEKVGGYNSQLISTAWEQPTLPAPQQRLVLCNGNTCRMVQADTPGNNDNISLSDLNAVAVVVGLDLHFNMVKLAYASMILQGRPGNKKEEFPQALFIATNEDPQIPIGADSILLPGAGTMVGPLSTAAGRAPDAVCGKPRVDMAKILFQAEGITNSRMNCIMIGDRLTTDVAFGNAAGCQSMLVLSGAEGMADVERAKAEGRKELLPDYVADSLACFLPA